MSEQVGTVASIGLRRTAKYIPYGGKVCQHT
jgi:hypothetical protein